MTSRDLYQRLKKEIDTVQVVDTHEHLYLPEEDYIECEPDFTQFLFQYNLDDLMSAGMEPDDPQEFADTLGRVLRVGGKVLSHDEKWEYIKPHWENARLTGYSRAVRHSLRKFFGIDDLTDETFREVTEKLRAMVKPGIYRTILRDICSFKTSVNDVDSMVLPGMFERLDRSLFHFAARFRHFSYCYFPGGIEHLENMFNRTIRSLDHLLDALDSQFDRWIEEGRVAIKMADAYLRDIHYEDSTRDEAERVMRRIFTLRKHEKYPETLTFKEARPLENFIVHRVLERAEEQGLPVIVHTGIQAHVRDELTHSRAALLTNLFRKYSKLRFHLLHSSYPWMYEAASLAKQFPNVSLDLTWTHVIVPAGARAGLSHMLDTVPVNKIHGFGGDYLVPVNIWGALEAARENIAHVLSEKVETGHMTESDGVALAHKILNSNAQEIFNLK